MSPTPDAQIDAAIAASPLMQKYGTAVDPESAKEMLEGKKAAAEQEQAQQQAEQPQQQQEQQGSGAADTLNQVLNSKTTQTAVNSLIRGIFGNGKRRR